MNLQQGCAQVHQARVFAYIFGQRIEKTGRPIANDLIQQTAKPALGYICGQRVNRDDAIGVELLLLQWLPFRVVHHQPPQVLVELPRKDDVRASMQPFCSPGLVEPVDAQGGSPVIDHCFNELLSAAPDRANCNALDRTNHSCLVAVMQPVDGQEPRIVIVATGEIIQQVA